MKHCIQDQISIFRYRYHGFFMLIYTVVVFIIYCSVEFLSKIFYFHHLLYWIFITFLRFPNFANLQGYPGTLTILWIWLELKKHYTPSQHDTESSLACRDALTNSKYITFLRFFDIFVHAKILKYLEYFIIKCVFVCVFVFDIIEIAVITLLHEDLQLKACKAEWCNS